jgi:hypothetical protein
MKYPVDTDGTIGAGTTVNIIDLAHENTDGTAMHCAGDAYVVRVTERDIIVVNPAGTTSRASPVAGSSRTSRSAGPTTRRSRHPEQGRLQAALVGTRNAVLERVPPSSVGRG